MMSERETDAKLVEELSEQIWPHVAPLLAGKGSHIQGGVLADLVARWLAGHVVPGKRKATRRVRESLLDLHVKTVRQLIPVNEKQLGTGLAVEKEQGHA